MKIVENNNKYGQHEYEVFGTKTNENNNNQTMFLIYKSNMWLWVYCDGYKPVQ